MSDLFSSQSKPSLMAVTLQGNFNYYVLCSIRNFLASYIILYNEIIFKFHKLSNMWRYYKKRWPHFKNKTRKYTSCDLSNKRSFVSMLG